MLSMTYACGRLSGPLQWLDQPCPTNQHLGQGQIRGLSHSALMYYILYFYVQPFSVQSSTFIVFYVRVLLHWDPFYIQSFYLQSSTFSLLRSVFLPSVFYIQSSTFSLLRSVFLHSIPPSATDSFQCQKRFRKARSFFLNQGFTCSRLLIGR